MCFIFLTGAQYYETVDVYNHFVVIFQVITVPLYCYVILMVQQSLIRIEKYQRIGCFGREFGELREWFHIEIFLFYCNLGVLVLYIAYNRIKKKFLGFQNKINMVWHNPAIDDMIKQSKMVDPSFEGHNCEKPEEDNDCEDEETHQEKILRHIVIINDKHKEISK